MPDVYLFQTVDDGDINISNGIIELNESPSSAAYISLFGGNMNGSSWWGDADLKSETQKFIQSYPPSSGNLLKIEEAILSDLRWMMLPPYSWTVSASASMSTASRVNIVVTINGTVYQYSQEWTK